MIDIALCKNAIPGYGVLKKRPLTDRGAALQAPAECTPRLKSMQWCVSNNNAHFKSVDGKVPLEITHLIQCGY